ncbi:hypothetical protein ACONUD_15365 [Microbulbifer harenosus]|uniref:CopL family metal-binding regulatory protein n=1 Tax=Microbulbifer harenosus TaxID=2576840 RepID=A0ABY2UR22_9GAMM|nr:hypothetical protein [Microbulbifer harenosus]TLM78995.1 hypothetical protein FDY93_02465 [Microbulbifer harenosus]
MRILVKILILWCFAVQSLALVNAPVCNQDAAIQDNSATSANHAMSDQHFALDLPMADSGCGGDTAPEHPDMSCCESTGAVSMDVCQLICASGGCGLAMAPQGFLPQTSLSPARYRPLYPSPISPIPQNLLRPPRRA